MSLCGGVRPGVAEGLDGSGPLLSDLRVAERAAMACGTTRLADITGLDRLGLPVFQAIRPLSRALSVHQGKALDPREAMLGALMEGVESHCAETFAGERRRSGFLDLPAAERAPRLSDFSIDRRHAPPLDEPLEWVEARCVLAPGRLWSPFDVVSLDFSRRGDARLDRSSNGLASRFDLNAALSVALLELVERDALAAFLDRPPHRRSPARLDLDSVDSPWLAALKPRLTAAGVRMTVHVAPSVIGAPVFVCDMLEPSAPEAGRSRVGGSACHPDPETALLKAVLEAAQSRLTAISGARDDLAATPQDARAYAGLGLSLPSPGRGVDWTAFKGGPGNAAADLLPLDAGRIAARLGRAGYGPCAYVDLSPPGSGVFVVKAIAPGLGADRRRRRDDRGLER